TRQSSTTVHPERTACCGTLIGCPWRCASSLREGAIRAWDGPARSCPLLQEFGGKALAVDLAVRIARQRSGPDFNVGRHHVGRQALATGFEQRRRVEHRVGL